MIKAVIIDDEPHCCEVLQLLLERYCPGVSITAVCYSAAEALAVLPGAGAQLVFLDIEMPHMNGFALLGQLPAIDFKLIFTTSYDQYAIKAIKSSALDYLLKPIDREELQAAVQKAIHQLQAPLYPQLEVLLQQLHQKPTPTNRIALPTMEGLQLVPTDSIISCTSSSNYTIFQLKENQKLTVSRTLKEIEEMLAPYPFLRVHHSYLVNINEIRRYIKGEGGALIMSDGSSVDVSRSKKETLLRALQAGK
jgi:two-component system LytT family response regulator